MSQPAMLQETPDFSLVLGGPLFQLFRRAHLSGTVLQLLHRRIIIITMIAVAAAAHLVITGRACLQRWCQSPIPARYRVPDSIPDCAAGADCRRVARPYMRLRPVLQRFVKRNIIIAEEMPKFHAAIDSATRWRNSISLELALLTFVYTVGHWLWRSQIALGTSSWYTMPEGGHWHLTPAGYWNAFVSIPIFQFLLLRWYLRLLIWFRLLWQVSRLNLHLVPTHPDRAAGLAFLGKSSYAFVPILFAQGALLAGLIASRVLYGGESLLSFKIEIVGMIGIFMLFILGPLTMFTPQLARAKRKGLTDYGLLASRYVDEFEKKWVVEVHHRTTNF